MPKQPRIFCLTIVQSQITTVGITQTFSVAHFAAMGIDRAPSFKPEVLNNSGSVNKNLSVFSAESGVKQMRRRSSSTADHFLSCRAKCNHAPPVDGGRGDDLNTASRKHFRQ